MKIIFDSNVWLAFFNHKEIHHKQSKELMKQYLSELIVPEYVALEVATVLQNKKKKQVADQFLTTIKNQELNLLPINQKTFWQSVNIFQAQNKKLSFVDATLVTLSQEYEIKTFDQALAKVILNLN